MNEKGANDQTFRFRNPSQVENILSQYPDRRSALLPLLHMATAEAGYITQPIINAVARIVEAHPSEIMETVSFYSMLHTAPKGEFILQICQTLPCSIRGADNLVDHLCERLSIQPGETTKDGKFTVMKVECLGACDIAPLVQVNNDHHEKMTVEKLDKLLKSLS
ncbi:MAG: NAD(P)H-dependent oxidoreductase subunit E [Candidatus Neomarinimicrobiota bacterium]